MAIRHGDDKRWHRVRPCRFCFRPITRKQRPFGAAPMYCSNECRLADYAQKEPNGRATKNR